MSEYPSPKAQIAWVRLVDAAQRAVRGIETALKRAGHPPLAWYDALLEIERAPGGRLRQRDLHRRMLLERYSISRLVERLEQVGLVEQMPCAGDRRGHEIAITDAGRTLRGAMWRVYGRAVGAEFTNHYDEAELESLARLLGRLAPGRDEPAP